MIELDGARGEGGGQILRSALTLSMITGRPFRITGIRARRPKPGLMRQHLVAVQAAAQVCSALVVGADIGSTELTFTPGRVKAGEYSCAIGTAGSCTLVLQTVALALLFADGPSTVRISGGTHNAMAPPAQFLQRAFCPVLAKMGGQIDVELLRYGFYPAGGGQLLATIKPCAQLAPLDLLERGELREAYAEAFVAGISPQVGLRELESVAASTGWSGDQLRMRQLPGQTGPGNAVLVTVASEAVTDVFAGYGDKSVRAHAVAMQAVEDAQQYMRSHAAVGEYLADQLMLPMAIAGAGSFTAAVLSQHALTNAEVISEFLPVRFDFIEEFASGAQAARHRITLAAK
ncbi:MAG: RNA 3'-terminal phosphate cyclase [Gammaproteobacteria bacterium]